MNPAISRAIAAVTTTFGFPLAARRRHRLHNRTCAFPSTVSKGDIEPITTLHLDKLTSIMKFGRPSF
jgi:hypothetical protein